MISCAKIICSARDRSKGQILIFVFLLLMLLTLLGGAVALMWETGLHSLSLQRESAIAFYLAQAGLERARDHLALSNGTSLDDLSGSLNNGTYEVSIKDHGHRGITSTGRYGTAERRIYLAVNLTGSGVDCSISPCPPYGNAWGYWRRFNNGWEEQ